MGACVCTWILKLKAHAISIMSAVYLQRLNTSCWLQTCDLHSENCCCRLSLHLHKKRTRKTFPSHMGPQRCADLCFCSPQPDTSLRCETADMGLVHRVVCLLMSQLSAVPNVNYTALWHGHTSANNLTRVVTQPRPDHNCTWISLL